MKLLRLLFLLVLTVPATAQTAPGNLRPPDNATRMLNAVTVDGSPAVPLNTRIYGAIKATITISGTATVNFEGRIDTSQSFSARKAVKESDTTNTIITSTATSGDYIVYLAGDEEFNPRVSGCSACTVTVWVRQIPSVGKAIYEDGGGGAPIDATFITQTPNATLTNEQALSALSTGLVKNTTTTGVLSIGVAGTDYQAPITFGTGVQTALGVNIGSAGSPVLSGGVLGTPSSGTATNLTGYVFANLASKPTTLSGYGITDAAPITSPTFITGLSSPAITNSGLTAGRVTFAGTGGLLSDDADMTFSTDTLTVTKLVTNSVNGNTFTAGTYTLTGTAAKTLNFTDNVTLSSDGTGTRTLNIGAGGTLGSNAFTSTAYAPLASPTFTGTVTLPAVTLGGTVSGGGQQLNNIIIGTTTPLAGSFTTLTATGATITGSVTETAASPIYNLNSTSTSSLAQFNFQENASGVAVIEVFGSAYATTDLRQSLVYNTNNAGTKHLFFINSTEVARINSTGLLVTGNTSTRHLIGTSTAPTIANGAGAGTSPGTPAIAGTDMAGQITIITGTLPSVSAVAVTVTFNAAYGTAPYVVIWPANAAAATLGFLPYVGSTTTTFTVNAGTIALGAATTYLYNFVVVQ